MPTGFCPRLSEARILLPLLRAQLAGAAHRYTLPINVALELLPIVEDGLFGYELVPSRNAHAYLTIGFNGTGEAVLRRTLCSSDAPGALRLATVDGKIVSRPSCSVCDFSQRRDSLFVEISDAVASGWSQLAALYPDGPRRPIELEADLHRHLDEALAVAYTHLSRWNPFIQFFGFPSEAHYGLALTGSPGEHGELVARRPDMWVLRWKSPEAVVYEEWEVVLPDAAGTGVSARYP
jgi:hypothetical protein